MTELSNTRKAELISRAAKNITLIARLHGIDLRLQTPEMRSFLIAIYLGGIDMAMAEAMKAIKK